jgi:hypothetical protein
MNASESEEEEEGQLLGHHFIYVFIIFCLSNVNMWLTGGDHHSGTSSAKGLELTTMFIQEVMSMHCKVKNGCSLRWPFHTTRGRICRDVLWQILTNHHIEKLLCYELPSPFPDTYIK